MVENFNRARVLMATWRNQKPARSSVLELVDLICSRGLRPTVMDLHLSLQEDRPVTPLARIISHQLVSQVMPLEDLTFSGLIIRPNNVTDRLPVELDINLFVTFLQEVNAHSLTPQRRSGSPAAGWRSAGSGRR